MHTSDAFAAAVEGKTRHKKLQLPHPCSSYHATAPSVIFDGHLQEHLLMSPLIMKSDKHFYTMVVVVQNMAV